MDAHTISLFFRETINLERAVEKMRNFTIYYRDKKCVIHERVNEIK